MGVQIPVHTNGGSYRAEVEHGLEGMVPLCPRIVSQDCLLIRVYNAKWIPVTDLKPNLGTYIDVSLTSTRDTDKKTKASVGKLSYPGA